MKHLKYTIFAFIAPVFSAPDHHRQRLADLKVRSPKVFPDVQERTSDFKGTVTTWTNHNCNGAPNGLWSSDLTTFRQPNGCLSLDYSNSMSSTGQILAIGVNPFSEEGTTNYLIHFYSDANCGTLITPLDGTGIDCLDPDVYHQPVFSFDIGTA